MNELLTKEIKTLEFEIAKLKESEAAKSKPTVSEASTFSKCYDVKIENYGRYI